MGLLRDSWNALQPQVASHYLEDAGSSSNSKRILVDVLAREKREGERLNILDLGCGNGHLFLLLRERGVHCGYTGVEFSEPLLEAARERTRGNPAATFLRDDVAELSEVAGPFDVAVFSHVLEMLEEPERALHAARRVVDRIAIRFFEPPEHEFDAVEIRELNVGGGQHVPYVRRRISRDMYALMLAKLGCTLVEVYHDELSSDQVHLLRF